MSEVLSNFVSLIAFYSQVLLSINSNIYIGEEKMTWYEANEWCRNRDSELISIHSDSEYDTIKSLEGIDEDNNYWTGLRHHGNPRNKSVYFWSDDTLFDYGLNFTFYPWNNIEPNVHGTMGCVRLQNTANHLWDDINCSSTLKGQKSIPLCQENAGNPTTSTLNAAATLIPTENTRFPSVASAFSTAFIATLFVFVATEKEAGVIQSTNITATAADAALYRKVNDQWAISSTTYIIIVSGCVVGICCMFIVGITLIKCTMRKHVHLQVRDRGYGYKKGQVMQHEHERVHTQSWNDEHVQYEIKASIELQLAESTALNPYDHDKGEQVLQNINVTKGYLEDEPHDGIISEIGDNDQRFSVLVSEGDVHRDGVRTVGFENVAPDEFIVIGDDENEPNVTNGITPDERHVIGEGEQHPY